MPTPECGLSSTPPHICAHTLPLLCLLCCNYRLANRNEGGNSNLKDVLSGDLWPLKQDNALNQSELLVPNKPEDNSEEKESELDHNKLSSSVIIEVHDVQSSLELSTITGRSTLCCFQAMESKFF